MVKCAHGLMPVPAPATALIVENVPVRTGLVQHEATTPTGAAILVATVDEFTDQINFQINKTAYGIGQRDVSEVPNVLRVYLSEGQSDANNVGNGIQCPNFMKMNAFFADVVNFPFGHSNEVEYF